VYGYAWSNQSDEKQDGVALLAGKVSDIDGVITGCTVDCGKYGRAGHEAGPAWPRRGFFPAQSNSVLTVYLKRLATSSCFS
jgi:hypothetical protein